MTGPDHSHRAVCGCNDVVVVTRVAPPLVFQELRSSLDASVAGKLDASSSLAVGSVGAIGSLGATKTAGVDVELTDGGYFAIIDPLDCYRILTLFKIATWCVV